MRKAIAAAILTFQSFFGKKEVDLVPDAEVVEGEIEPILEPDEWVKLTQDMYSSDPAVVERARSTWNEKAARDALFFGGWFDENITMLGYNGPPRGIPQNLREGWIGPVEGEEDLDFFEVLTIEDAEAAELQRQEENLNALEEIRQQQEGRKAYEDFERQARDFNQKSFGSQDTSFE